MTKLQEAAPPDALPVEKLYRQCDPAELDFQTTGELEPLADHFGQDRAVEALEFGLAMPHEGYNIFVLGSTGVGKRELLNSLLDEKSAPQGEVSDWVYVNNFDTPDQPLALRLPPGKALELQHDMAHAVEELLSIVPATFQSDEYQARVQELGEGYQSQEKDAFQRLAEKAARNNIAMVQTPAGYTLAPLKDGEIMNPQEFEAQPEEVKKKTLAVIEELKEELKALVRQMPGWKKESRSKFKALNQEFSRIAIEPVFAELKQKYASLPEVLEYLEAAHRNVMENAEAFAQVREESAIPDNMKTRVAEFPQYSVNVLVNNAESSGPPIVHEDNPTFGNLIGRSENVAQMGTLVTDFTLIKPGALHRANGGYLVLEAVKVLTNPFAWQALKRALKAREVRIQSLEQLFSWVNTVQLRPQPIPLDVKVVITGDRYIYYLLEQYDPEFATLFKVAADMSEDVPRGPESTVLFARLIATLAQQNGLQTLSSAGVARVIEHCARRVEDAERLSLHQGKLNDLLCESDHYARKAGSDSIEAEHVSEAVRAATRRLDQFREKSHESILREIMLVDTSGAKVGQVNGLAVYLLGDYAFGKPTRITATARLGSGKVLDIEREVDLGGKIHSKAVMIISALMANRYARNQPLHLAATLAFEQSYGGIEGDSASVAEFAALVSALAQVPVKQNLAVTGSLNQHGQVQAIGGVNEKIEGFFDICRERGLTGDQGVVIPAANEVHLMLREEVLDAVAAGSFHVYSVRTIDEALSLLTGVSAGELDDAGIYPDGSLNAAVMTRVTELNALAKKFGGKGDGEDDAAGDGKHG
jgi:lon-related putative ATP-dependent protease